MKLPTSTKKRKKNKLLEIMLYWYITPKSLVGAVGRIQNNTTIQNIFLHYFLRLHHMFLICKLVYFTSKAFLMQTYLNM